MEESCQVFGNLREKDLATNGLGAIWYNGGGFRSNAWIGNDGGEGTTLDLASFGVCPYSVLRPPLRVLRFRGGGGTG